MNKIKSALGAVGSVAGAYLGLTLLIRHEVFERGAKLPAIINEKEKKKDKNAPKRHDERTEWMKHQAFTTYNIKNKRGETLCAHYLAAAQESDKYVLCSHGYRNKGKGEFRFITKFYHENGYNVLLVDHRASGESEGEHITFGYYESSDLRRWANFLVDTFGKDIKIAVHGISMGAVAAIMLAARDKLPENIKFIIADCAFTSAKKQFENVLKDRKIPSKALVETVNFLNKLFHGYSLSRVKPINALKKATLPILFIHGKNDTFVKPEMTEEMYEAYEGEKDILLVENAGHAQSYQRNSEAYEKKILEFTEKYF